MKTSYIYLNYKSYDGTVFVTQIADWLRLYNENGIKMHYCHQFLWSAIFHRSWRKTQLNKIKTVVPEIFNVSISLPERSFFCRMNAIMLNRMLNKKFPDSDRIVILSRMLYGKEIAYLKQLSRKEIIFIYDARAASYEEQKYNLSKLNDKDKSLEHVRDVEGVTVRTADRIFCVSNVLKEYLSAEYGVEKSRFFIYPCLSDSNKFYYNEELRKRVRDELKYTDEDRVYIYSGGLKNKYHLVIQTLTFFDEIAAKDKSAYFIFLSKDTLSDSLLQEKYPHLVNRIHITSVSNEEVYKYLNAADFGTLFRDDVPMNNVASPSKFAEYILCGLPVIISKGVGDYTDLCVRENLGVKVDEFVLTDEIWRRLTGDSFDRKYIADYGKRHLSKQSYLQSILKEFLSYSI